MEGLMQRVGVELIGGQSAPNNIVQEFVNSRLLIDLLSIVDKAVDVMFNKYGFKEKDYSKPKQLSRLAILIKNEKLYNAPYLR